MFTSLQMDTVAGVIVVVEFAGWCTYNVGTCYWNVLNMNMIGVSGGRQSLYTSRP